MGCTANELKEVEDTPAFDARISAAKLREVLVKAKVYSDTWNDEQRRKVNVQKCGPARRPALSRAGAWHANEAAPWSRWCRRARRGPGTLSSGTKRAIC
jgi:hypothetical protein